MLLCLMQARFAESADFSNVQYKDIDLSAVFNGVNGCAVLYTAHDSTFEVFNEKLALSQQTPQSTFKIVSTLMGLEYGIIADEKSQMHYNGTQYELDVWNKNVTLKEAFQYSCVWYYHQLVYGISRSKVSYFLKKLNYGNQDISQWKGSGSSDKDELNGFWLSSSLKISPFEQVQVLYNIFEYKTFVDIKYVSVLKNIMKQEISGQTVYAKTGSNMKGESWFVGFFATAKGRKYFAFYVDDPTAGVSGAKKVAVSFFENKK